MNNFLSTLSEEQKEEVLKFIVQNTRVGIAPFIVNEIKDAPEGTSFIFDWNVVPGDVRRVKGLKSALTSYMSSNATPFSVSVKSFKEDSPYAGKFLITKIKLRNSTRKHAN